MSPLGFRLAGTPAERAAAAALRTEVFVREQGVDPAIEQDGLDETADHALGYDDRGVVVATGRLIDPGPRHPDDPAVGTVGRMAVRRDARGHGYGRAVLRTLEVAAADRGLMAIALNAQLHAAGFYSRAGYSAYGEAFMEAGLEHLRMRRPLLSGLRPVRDADAAAVQTLIGSCFAEYAGCVLDLEGIDVWMRRPATAFEARRGGLWVVEADDGLRAACGWTPVAAGTVELKSLYVAASARRRGLAARLLHRVERVARAVGAVRVQLWSDTRFLDAHRFYERHGYQRLPETRDLHDPSQTTEYHFTRALSQTEPAGLRLRLDDGPRRAPGLGGQR